MPWWGPEAADQAIASFLPTLRGMVSAAYKRAGSPYGEADDDTETLERWLEGTRDTDTGEALEREIEEAWTFHLELCFAARQVN